jgi:hypothetical protein
MNLAVYKVTRTMLDAKKVENKCGSILTGRKDCLAIIE